VDWKRQEEHAIAKLAMELSPYQQVLLKQQSTSLRALQPQHQA
jgi:hypothetical protein